MSPRPPPTSSFADVPELVRIVTDAAKPLLPGARPAFFEAVNAALAAEAVAIGVGSLSRICREVQRRFVDAAEPRPAGIRRR